MEYSVSVSIKVVAESREEAIRRVHRVLYPFGSTYEVGTVLPVRQADGGYEWRSPSAGETSGWGRRKPLEDVLAVPSGSATLDTSPATEEP